MIDYATLLQLAPQLLNVAMTSHSEEILQELTPEIIERLAKA